MAWLESPLSLFTDLKKQLVGDGQADSVAQVKAFLSLMEPTHKLYTRQWYFNIAFFMGNQNIVWDKGRGSFSNPSAPSWRVRTVYNKIMPLARAQMSRIVETNIQIYAIPGSESDADNKAAKVSSKIIKSIKDSDDFGFLEQDLVAYQVLCGNSFIMPFYDKDAGKEMTIEKRDEAGNVIFNPDGTPQTYQLNTGDLLHDVISPFELVPDYSATYWDHQKMVVRKKIRSIDYLKSRYGKDLDLKEETIPQDSMDSLRVADMVSASGVTSNIQSTIKNAVITKEAWIMPDEEHPNGQHLMVAGDVEIFNEPLESKLRGKRVIPISHIKAIHVPGKLMGKTSVEDTIPLQCVYNRFRNLLVENGNLIGGPKLIAPIGSVTEDTYDDRPLGIITYDPAAGSAPAFHTPTPMASYVMDAIRLVITEMEDIFGIHDISQGRLPRRATSGVALGILEEKDQIIINPMKKFFLDALQRDFSIAIGIAKKSFPEERIIKILDKNGKTDFVSWRSSDIESVEDIKLMKDTALPSTRAAKFELGLNLANAGIVTKEAALKVMNLEDLGQLETITPDYFASKMIEMENVLMAKGEDTYPTEFENHAAHIKGHSDFLVANPNLPDDVKRRVLKHNELTKLIKQLKDSALTPQRTPGTMPGMVGGNGVLPGSAPEMASNGSLPADFSGEGLEF